MLEIFIYLVIIIVIITIIYYTLNNEYEYFIFSRKKDYLLQDKSTKPKKSFFKTRFGKHDKIQSRISRTKSRFRNITKPSKHYFSKKTVKRETPIKTGKPVLPTIYKCDKTPPTNSDSYEKWLECVVQQTFQLYPYNSRLVSSWICKLLVDKNGYKLLEHFFKHMSCYKDITHCNSVSFVKKNSVLLANLLVTGFKNINYSPKYIKIIGDDWLKLNDFIIGVMYPVMKKSLRYLFSGSLVISNLYIIRRKPKWLIDIITTYNVNKISGISGKLTNLAFQIRVLDYMLKIQKSTIYDNEWASVRDFNPIVLHDFFINKDIQFTIENYNMIHNNVLGILKSMGRDVVLTLKPGFVANLNKKSREIIKKYLKSTQPKKVSTLKPVK